MQIDFDRVPRLLTRYLHDRPSQPSCEEEGLPEHHTILESPW